MIADISVHSPYDWVPTSSLLANPSTEAHSTTKSQKEQSSSATKAGAAPSTSTSAAALPSQWPSKIVPQDDSGNTTAGTDKDNPIKTVNQAEDEEVPIESTLISILLSSALSWSWLLSNADASAQVFAYMPVLLAEALDIGQDQVTTDSLEAIQPPSWSGDGGDMCASICLVQCVLLINICR